MSDENRSVLIEEIEKKLEEFLNCSDISDERKKEVVRELLRIAVKEQ